MDSYTQTPRTRVHRLPQRATYEREAIHAILDEALVAHVAFVDEGQPFVLPMAFVRLGESLYLHGSTRTRMLARMASGAPVSATATLLDGLVLARSAFHHSLNYRSVSVLGNAQGVEDEALKRRALDALTEKVVPGRSAHIRGPNAQELKATAVVELPLDEVSGKVRIGPPIDDDADLALNVWAGVVPLHLSAGVPQPDTALDPAIALPDHIRNLLRRWY